MSKLRKSVMMLAVLFASSAAFVSCSDDNDFPKGKLGASYIQAITAGSTSVDLRWTITPTENVDGYLVQIYQGEFTSANAGSKGSPVASGTFGKKQATGTFNGLQPNTTYTVTTECIPAAGSGFSSADVAYYVFYTAPQIDPTAASAVVYQGTMTDEETGETVPAVDASGNPVYDADLTISWSPTNLTQLQLGGLYIYIENSAEKQIYYNLFTPAEGWDVFPSSTTVTVPNVVPGDEIMIDLFPNPNNYTFYTTATAPDGIMYYTLPEATE